VMLPIETRSRVTGATRATPLAVETERVKSLSDSRRPARSASSYDSTTMVAPVSIITGMDRPLMSASILK
jgi:hypothetical protein